MRRLNSCHNRKTALYFFKNLGPSSGLEPREKCADSRLLQPSVRQLTLGEHLEFWLIEAAEIPEVVV